MARPARAARDGPRAATAPVTGLKPRPRTGRRSRRGALPAAQAPPRSARTTAARAVRKAGRRLRDQTPPGGGGRLAAGQLLDEAGDPVPDLVADRADLFECLGGGGVVVPVHVWPDREQA